MIPLKDNIPNERFPLITVLLVAINVVAYLLSIRHGGSLIGGPDNGVAVKYGAIPYELTHGGSHCGLVSGPGMEAAVACTGQLGVIGTPASQPATWEAAGPVCRSRQAGPGRRPRPRRVPAPVRTPDRNGCPRA